MPMPIVTCPAGIEIEQQYSGGCVRPSGKPAEIHCGGGSYRRGRTFWFAYGPNEGAMATGTARFAAGAPARCAPMGPLGAEGPLGDQFSVPAR